MNQALTIYSDATGDDLFTVVSDLQTYPHWLDLVNNVQADGTDAYLVTITAKLGPFARSKKLRMVSSIDTGKKQATFTRQEIDGREHSGWVMQAVVEETDNSKQSKLDVSLHYDGSLWTGALEKVLDSHTARSTKKLNAYLKAQASA